MKERNRNPLVARRIKIRKVMNRAHAIAKNAHNTLISNSSRIAIIGASYSAKDFFQESLKLAWKEQKLGTELYSLNGSLPRKVLPRIEESLQIFMDTFNPDNYKTEQYNFNLAKTALIARYDDKTNPDEIYQLSLIAYGEVNTQTSRVA
jgi:hypothetical protein